MEKQLQVARDVFKRLGEAEDYLREERKKSVREVLVERKERNIRVLAEKEGWKYKNNDHREQGVMCAGDDLLEVSCISRTLPGELDYDLDTSKDSLGSVIGDDRPPQPVEPEITLHFTVEITPTRDATVYFSPQDDPLVTAEEFVTTQGLPPELVPSIAARFVAIRDAEKEKIMKQTASKIQPSRTPLARISMNTPRQEVVKPVTQPTAAVPNKKIGLKAGQRLYREGVLHQQATEVQMKRLQAMKERQEIEAATFSPVISTAAKRIQRRDPTYRKRPSPPHILRMEDEEMLKCTFMPKISSKSEKIMQNLRTTAPHVPPAYETLYIDAEDRRRRNTEREAAYFM